MLESLEGSTVGGLCWQWLLEVDEVATEKLTKNTLKTQTNEAKTTTNRPKSSLRNGINMTSTYRECVDRALATDGLSTANWARETGVKG